MSSSLSLGPTASTDDSEEEEGSTVMCSPTSDKEGSHALIVRRGGGALGPDRCTDALPTFKGPEGSLLVDKGLFLESIGSLNHPSEFSHKSFSPKLLSPYCDLRGGYKFKEPGPHDKIWMSFSHGWHAMPLLLFECGMRLPLHPWQWVVG